jgi:hypothetical protein
MGDKNPKAQARAKKQETVSKGAAKDAAKKKQAPPDAAKKSGR